MTGTVVLHPVSGAEKGMGFSSLRLDPGAETVYLVPGIRMAHELRRRWQEYGWEGKPVTFLTLDQFVRNILPPSVQQRLMTPVEQELLIQRAVARVKADTGFTYFRGMTDREGWLKKVEARIGEIKRAGVLPGRLQRLWRDRGANFQELARIYEAYQRLLERYQLFDHEEPYYCLMKELQKGQVHLPRQVVAEHFHDLSVLQEQLFVQLVTAGVSVFLHLVWDDGRPRLFRETSRTVERLRRQGFVLRKAHRTDPERKRPPLIHLEKQAFSAHPRSAEAGGTVEWISAPGVEREAEEVVARLKRWLAETGAPLSEAALISPAPEIYHPALWNQLESAGLPCETARTRPLRSHPLMQMVLTALRVRLGREEMWPALMESPYLPWGKVASRAGWIRSYRRLGRPKGSADLERSLRQQGLAAREELKSLIQLFQWVEEVPMKASWNEWVDWFSGWTHILKRSREWKEMARDPRLLPVVAEEAAACNGLVSILEEWRHMFQQTGLGKEEADLPTFIAMLERAADRVQVQGAPGRRGGVRLLEPNQVRGDRYRAVFMLGCAEGRWPRPIREDWLVSDDERIRLREESVHLATSREQQERQLYPFYQCAAAATELLVFSHSFLSEEGKEQLPSPYLEEALRVFEPGSVIRTRLETGDLLPRDWESCTSLERGLERAIYILHREVDENPEVERARVVVEEFRRERPRSHRSLSERILAERMRWGRDLGCFDGVLSPDSVWLQTVEKELEDRIWSVTQLNELVQCRFHFFAGRLLKAVPEEDAEEGISPLERGEMLHRILCRFWDRYRKGPIPDLESARKHLSAVAKTVFREFAEKKDGEVRDLIRFRIEINRLRQQLFAMLDHEWEWRGKHDSTLRPRYLELGFGLQSDPHEIRQGDIDPETRSDPAVLTLPDGRRIRLQGKVDRVDVDEEGYYALYDYKSGNAPTAEEVRAGLHLQLPMYLWVMQETFGLDPKKALGAAFYTAGARKDGRAPTNNRNQGLWRKELAERAGIHPRSGGVLEEEAWTAVQDSFRQVLARQLDLASQGNFAVAPRRECPAHCPHRTVCRVDDQRLALKRDGGSKGREEQDGYPT